MSTFGPIPASVVNGARFRLTSRLQFTISQFQDEGSPTFMWILLDLSISLVGFPIFSQSLIVPQDDCAKVLLRSWIPHFGVPSVITSYRGKQFTGSIWTSLCKFLGIVHSPTASTPQSIGIVEKFHRQLKVSLRAWLAGSGFITFL